jgi:hypothetical protein
MVTSIDRAQERHRLKAWNAEVSLEVSMALVVKGVVFWDIKTPVRTSQETHSVSAPESNRLMLCKI